MPKRWTWVVPVVLLLAIGAAEAHKKQVRPDSGPAAAAADTAKLSTPVAKPAPGGAAGEEPPYRMPPLREAVLEHLHNKIVHFPIALTLIAAAFLILARSKPQLEPIAFWLVWAAALSALAAYFSGKFQEEAFEGGPKEWLVELHEKQGIAIGLSLAAWVLMLLWGKARRFAWVWGIVLSVMVLAAGFLGGQVAHGE